MMNSSMMPNLVNNNQYASFNGPPDMYGQDMGDQQPYDNMGGYADGGNVHERKEPREMEVMESMYIPAHFNKGELHGLDEAQGVRTNFPGTNIRVYKRLHQLFKDNPDLIEEIKGMVHGNHQQQYAHGGSVQDDIEELSRNGRYGDTEMAFITPQLRDILDTIRGHSSKNPHDGSPEYFSLNFGGALDALKGAARSAWGGIKKYAPEVGHYAGVIGNQMLDDYGGQLVQGAAEKNPLLGMAAGLGLEGARRGAGFLQGMGSGAEGGQGQFDRYAQDAAKGIGGASAAYSSGASPQEAIASGAKAAIGSREGMGADLGRYAADQYGRTGNIRDTAFGTANQATNYLPQQVQSIARTGLQSYQQNRSLPQAGMAAAQEGVSQHVPQQFQGIANQGLNRLQSMYKNRSQPQMRVA